MIRRDHKAGLKSRRRRASTQEQVTATVLARDVLCRLTEPRLYLNTLRDIRNAVGPKGFRCLRDEHTVKIAGNGQELQSMGQYPRCRSQHGWHGCAADTWSLGSHVSQLAWRSAVLICPSSQRHLLQSEQLSDWTTTVLLLCTITVGRAACRTSAGIICGCATTADRAGPCATSSRHTVNCSIDTLVLVVVSQADMSRMIRLVVSSPTLSLSHRTLLLSHTSLVVTCC